MKKEIKEYTHGEWKLNPLRDPTRPEYYCIYVKEGDHTTVENIVTVTDLGLKNREHVHGNSARIVKCVNMHDNLISMIKELRTELRAVQSSFYYDDTEREITDSKIERAEQLLEQAELK